MVQLILCVSMSPFSYRRTRGLPAVETHSFISIENDGLSTFPHGKKYTWHSFENFTVNAWCFKKHTLIRAKARQPPPPPPPPKKKKKKKKRQHGTSQSKSHLRLSETKTEGEGAGERERVSEGGWGGERESEFGEDRIKQPTLLPSQMPSKMNWEREREECFWEDGKKQTIL